MSRWPPEPWWKTGSEMSFLGMASSLAPGRGCRAVHRAAHGLADLLLVAPQEALAVADRLVLARKPTVDDLLQHRIPRSDLAPAGRPADQGSQSAALAHAQVPQQRTCLGV
jgi:hypothetical protein